MEGLQRPFLESIQAKKSSVFTSIKAIQRSTDFFYNETQQQFIFPVNNMETYNREKLSTLVRTYVTGHDKAVSK